MSDSIMDRIKNDAYKINIQAIDAKHDSSMREVYGLRAFSAMKLPFINKTPPSVHELPQRPEGVVIYI